MKKYNTKPIDFTGCHPVIAEHLKRCEIVKCKVWDFGRDREREIEAWIYRYLKNSSHPYISESDTPWKNAEPIPIKTHRVMPPERAIPTLIAEGWVFDDSGDMVGCRNRVVPPMFKLMGKPLSDPKTYGWVWPACIIEEVEDE